MWSPPGRIVHEVVRVLQEGVAHDRRDVLPPVGNGLVEQRLDAVHVVQVGEVVVVVAREQLVGGGSAHGDAVAVLVDRLHQQPVHEVGDRVERRVVVADQLAQLRQEAVGVGGDGRVAHAQLALRVLDHVLLLVALVFVDDREAVDVVVEDVLGDRDQRHRVHAAAHAEGERHVGAQAQLHRADQPLARAGHRLLVGEAVGRRPSRVPVAPAALLAGGPALEPGAGVELLAARRRRCPSSCRAPCSR